MSSLNSPVEITNETLSQIPSAVSTPSYARASLRQGIVHIGVGGFHRSHLATYAHELCEMGNTDWAILGAGVLTFDEAMQKALDPQDGLYTLISRGPDETDVSIIGSITGYLLAHPDAAELIAAIAKPSTQIVSLTVTEGGYPIDDATGLFAADSPVAGPNSAFAILVAGLQARQEQGHGKLTVLSCDNIMSNGHAAQTSTLGEAGRSNPDLVAWIDANVSFPNSMVDRITPATSDADRTWLAETYSITDLWPVVAEPFRQWVLEDNFAGERPPLEDLDIIVTDDVEPYEHMKLRLLNAGHSCLAYLAALDGIETVDKAMANPSIRSYVASFLTHEAKPVLPPVEGIDIDQYNASLIERFSNPAVGDQVSRLCLDGSAKFPKFLLPTLRAQLGADEDSSGHRSTEGSSIQHSALALAAWCLYLNGTDCAGNPIDIASDPLLDEAKSFAAAEVTEPGAFLAFTQVFGDLGHNEAFRNAFVSAFGDLRERGVPSAIESCLDSE